MIIREREPLNLEMPFGSLDGFITPVEQFFVRSHFELPDIDVTTSRLKIEGEVETPLELTYGELRKMKTHTLPVTLECAGNGRAFLAPQVKGAQWERGAVGNAEWTGVRLADVLQLTGVKDSAREVIFEGADKGEIKEPPGPAGKIHFARSVPLAKACDDVLLAFQMNGAELTPAHGFPLRAVVPGWYGVASVKWLTRIMVTSKPFQGYYQTIEYSSWETGPHAPALIPITGMQVKAEIARPGFAEAVSAGEHYLVTGAAWTSEAAVIMKVEVSTDGGATWQKARLLGDAVRHAWRLWEFDWEVPSSPGKAMLIARATDSEGRTQPLKRDEDRGSYMINHLTPIEVEVR